MKSEWLATQKLSQMSSLPPPLLGYFKDLILLFIYTYVVTLYTKVYIYIYMYGCELVVICTCTTTCGANKKGHINWSHQCIVHFMFVCICAWYVCLIVCMYVARPTKLGHLRREMLWLPAWPTAPHSTANPCAYWTSWQNQNSHTQPYAHAERHAYSLQAHTCGHFGLAAWKFLILTATSNQGSNIKCCADEFVENCKLLTYVQMCV